MHDGRVYGTYDRLPFAGMLHFLLDGDGDDDDDGPMVLGVGGEEQTRGCHSQFSLAGNRGAKVAVAGVDSLFVPHSSYVCGTKLFTTIIQY